MVGHPDDSERESNRGRTSVAHNNAFNPTWADDRFDLEIAVPELAFLEVRVKDKATGGVDLHVGSFCAPVRVLQQGKMYRKIVLV